VRLSQSRGKKYIELSVCVCFSSRPSQSQSELMKSLNQTFTASLVQWYLGPWTLYLQTELSAARSKHHSQCHLLNFRRPLRIFMQTWSKKKNIKGNEKKRSKQLRRDKLDCLRCSNSIRAKFVVPSPNQQSCDPRMMKKKTHHHWMYLWEKPTSYS